MNQAEEMKVEHSMEVHNKTCGGSGKRIAGILPVSRLQKGYETSRIEDLCKQL